MAKKTAKKAAARAAGEKNSARRKRSRSDSKSARLIPPDDGAVVRMYRTGHGDCFLLAFAGKSAGKPAYVLIDCGYKPGSPKFINTSAQEIVRSIHDATGGRIDVAVITHEHQDHVNGITAAHFGDFEIGETWLAWTEDPADALANRLRVTFRDKLLGLLAARNRLAAAANASELVNQIDELLAFEWGGEDEAFSAAAMTAALLGAAGAESANKKSMKVFKDLAQEGVKYIRPQEEILGVRGAKDVRVFAFGPPRDEDLITDLNPRGEEEFHLALAAASPGNYFAAAATAKEFGGKPQSPFSPRHHVAQEAALQDVEFGTFFTEHYGADAIAPSFAQCGPVRGEDECFDNPGWRRIDETWLLSAGQLALAMNSYTNNSSLVLGFELGRGGKVLFFAADAQRGNWVSWADHDWQDGRRKVTAKDLLARTVLYKVGHHGSHNATLNGTVEDEHPNLGWMGRGEYAREFTAMITAVRAWAETQKGWDHPLKAIKDALIKKAAGRVFQTDCDLEKMKAPKDVTMSEWKRFMARCRGDRLYIDYTVTRG